MLLPPSRAPAGRRAACWMGVRWGGPQPRMGGVYCCSVFRYAVGCATTRLLSMCGGRFGVGFVWLPGCLAVDVQTV